MRARSTKAIMPSPLLELPLLVQFALRANALSFRTSDFERYARKHQHASALCRAVSIEAAIARTRRRHMSNVAHPSQVAA